jgi:alkyl hydroperoxide reductase subunit AhpC
MSDYSTMYWWSVNARDTNGSGEWTNETYCFTTGADQPVVLDVYPHNEWANYNPRLSVEIVDYQDDPLSVTFRKKASNGSWQTIGTYNGGSGVYTQDTQDMDVEDQYYFWSVNISYGNNTWTNETYNFKAKPFVLKWVNTNTPPGTLGPLAVDVNKDGIYEIFITGEGRIICVNGSNGETIWEYNYTWISEHSPFEIADLNNDGIEEVVISCNTSQSGIIGRTIAVHANNGSLYWNVEAPSARRHLVVADIEGNGYPYVYVCCHVSEPDGGKIRMLRGTDGAILKEIPVYYPCYGGLSIADMDNDGEFELVLADYAYSYGKGTQCYDARDLTLKWFQRANGDPQLAALVDVNNDSILDAVTGYKWICVVDGATGEKMPGKWSQHDYPSHSSCSVYDIDGDGNLEMLICEHSQVKVWDLGRWALDATLETHQEPPLMADVIGDEKLEIIGTSGSESIKIYNETYDIVETINTVANRWTLVQDVDNDGQNELIITTGGNKLKCYDTSAYAPTPRVRTNSLGYSERNTGAGIYIPPPGAPQPILKEEFPANGSKDIGLNPTLLIHAIDFHYDLMNITISTNASGSWTNATFTDVGNGWYNFTPGNISELDTIYYWRVTARDPYADDLTTNETYSFSTISPPKITNVGADPSVVDQGEPVNISCNVSDDVEVDTIKMNIEYPNGNTSNITIWENVWDTLAYDDFENGWGNYTAGGGDCGLYTGDTYAYQGNNAVNIQNNSGVASSFNLTNPIDIHTPEYTSIKIEFWINANSMEDNEKWYLEYYNGSDWEIRREYRAVRGSFAEETYTDSVYRFANWLFFHDVVFINETDYNFPANMNIRFRCSASDDNDDVYIDAIYINATIGESDSYYYNDTYTTAGTYNYSIWANDINGYANISDTYSFKINDTEAPGIVDNTLDSAGTGNSFTFNATVTDNIDVANVYVYYWHGSEPAENKSMSQIGSTDYYEKEIAIYSNSTDILHYNISAVDAAGNWVETGQQDVTIYDDDSPVMNISCDVDDNIAVDEVWVNVSGPAGFTPVNTTMDVDAADSYYYNANYSIVGTYNYSIWANDTVSNSITSATEQFGIATDGAPSITDNSPNSANTSDSFIVNVSVSDVDGVNGVWVEYWFGAGGPKTSESMINTGGEYWEYNSISIPSNSDDDLFYNVSAVDTYGFWGHLANQQVVVSDNISPVISNVSAEPDPQIAGEYVMNISCDVDDNIAVDEVWVNVSGPAGFTPVNTTMDVDAAGSYYYNASSGYDIIGIYNYFIWANDKSNNSIISSVKQFSIKEA